MNEINSQIDNFCSYFKRQASVIKGLRSVPRDADGVGSDDYQIRFYQKILLVTALDTFAGIRFPKENYPSLHKKNRERFIRFISEYSDWQNGSRVSLPFLFDDLDKHASNNSRLLSFIKSNIDRFDPKDGILLTPDQIDMLPQQLLEFASTEKEEELIWYYQHYALLYRYRNFLVHESREPGYAIDGIRDTESEAYYHGYINKPKWHLAYPTELFNRIFINCLNNLKVYLSENQIDPFAFVGDTTRW
jgi:hypothetical protein